jgi:7-carboxy-7-deazaguanine synthase
LESSLTLPEGSSQSKQDSLLVSEIFKSVQGEGACLGAPTVFLRLAVCNLHCWYCDTKYTWMYSAKTLKEVKRDMSRLGIEREPGDLKVYTLSQEARSLHVKEALDKILEYGMDHLVLTGGEPLLQQQPLTSLLLKLKEARRNYFVEIETNGSVRASEALLGLVDQWNVSPKLESSGNSNFSREKKECMKAFGSLGNSYFKFVVQTKDDLDEVESLVRRYSIKPSKIILMPEGTEAAILRERTIWLSEICESRGYRLTPRLHILLWGNKRGT